MFKGACPLLKRGAAIELEQLQWFEIDAHQGRFAESPLNQFLDRSSQDSRLLAA